MGVFEHFPYTNFHDLNLDKILERTKAAETAVAASAQAAEDAADLARTADDNATLALNTANSAASDASDALTASGNAVNTANNAANDAASALSAVASVATPAVVLSNALVDSDNLFQATIIDGGGRLMGRLLLFRLIFRAGGTTAYIPFKSPYKVISSMPAQIYYASNNSYPPDTFVGLSYYNAASGFMMYQLTSGEQYTLTGVVLVDPAA